MAEVTLFQERKPSHHLLKTIYDPDIHDDPNGWIIPVPGSLVLDDEAGGRLYWVKDVDPVTFKTTLQETMIIITSEQDVSFASIVSYRNDIFRVFYDPRTSPLRLQPDPRLVLYGNNLGHYRLVRRKGHPDEVVISRLYDTDGQYTSDLIPLTRFEEETTREGWYCPACHTTVTPIDNELITVEVFNDQGALVATVTCFIQPSTIIAEPGGYRPAITGMTITSSQKRSQNEIFIYERQSVQSLVIGAQLHYDDGRVVDVDIDGSKCFLYGTEDFVSSWSGLRQPILVKYYLSRDEVLHPNIDPGCFITTQAYLVVVPNELDTPIKLSVIPYWNDSVSRYDLRYVMYNTDRTSVRDVTAYVTIDQHTFDGTAYGVQQQFAVALNLHHLDPVAYSQEAYHRQVVVVKVKPPTLLERYVIRDSMESALVYGADTPEDRRPLLYMTSAGQFYIPSSWFSTDEAVISAFYTHATPPYVPDREEAPPTPTHFIVRDAWTLQSLVVEPIPIEDYAIPFSTISDTPVSYITKTVIVEFLHRVDVGTMLILYGVPVDVHAAP